MLRPPRRRFLRSALALLLLAAAVAAIAQLAGVAGRGGPRDRALVFDGTHERWLVRAPGTSADRLDTATARLGGGKAGRELAGDWYEVKLGDEVAAADAEAAFAAVGATAVEPVVPRLPYDEPGAAEDPATAVAPTAAPDHEPTAAGAGEPEAIDDPPAAFTDGNGTVLRNGPLTAPRLREQWALAQDSDQDVDAPEAWQTSTGSGAVVAVIDTGVDASHPDLAGRVLEGRDFSGSSTGAHVDKVGHGTAVASVIAANGTSMAGIAPDAKILPLKVFRDSAGAFSMSGYLSAIRYAADQGVDVINISLGCGGTTSCFSQAELDALTYANSKGVLVVAAAGNGNNGTPYDNDAPDTPDFPSGYDLPGLVSVTASTRLGNWSTWANYGANAVDLAAPGEAILVASPSGSYRVLTGTSFSAPLAAGAAALVAAAHPELAPADLRARLIESAVDTASLRTRSVSGGVLNAAGALDALGTANAGGPGTAPTTPPTAAAPNPLGPRNAALVGSPPVLTWSLPAGWTSQRVLLSGAGAKFDRPVAPTARALAHPVDAWRSGTYRWQVVGRDAAGRTVTSAPRTYRIAPRLGAWVTSGRVRGGGRDVRLRVGYAASEPTARVQVIVSAGGKVVHRGKAVARTAHTKGAGSPRRGWFAYSARMSRVLEPGERITVEVRVTAGGAKLTRRFRATVA